MRLAPGIVVVKRNERGPRTTSRSALRARLLAERRVHRTTVAPTRVSAALRRILATVSRGFVHRPYAWMKKYRQGITVESVCASDRSTPFAPCRDQSSPQPHDNGAILLAYRELWHNPP